MAKGAHAERLDGTAAVDSQIGRAFIGLREMLLHGELARGERISELPLVARLGTSRTPIRLALERLAHIGLLDVLPRAASRSGGSRSPKCRTLLSSVECSKGRPLDSQPSGCATMPS